MDKTSARFVQERKTLAVMLGIYCRGHHDTKALCDACGDLLAYAEAQLEKCRYGESKPKCSQCRTHCYKPAMRERIREVMKYAGPRMLPRHPVLAVRHLVHGVAHKPGKVSGKRT